MFFLPLHVESNTARDRPTSLFSGENGVEPPVNSAMTLAFLAPISILMLEPTYTEPEV